MLCYVIIPPLATTSSQSMFPTKLNPHQWPFMVCFTRIERLAKIRYEIFLCSSGDPYEQESVAYAATSSSTVLYASVIWAEDRLVLTIEHLSALIPYIQARFVSKTRFFRAMLHAVTFVIGILLLSIGSIILGLRSDIVEEITFATVASVVAALFPRRSRVPYSLFSVLGHSPRCLFDCTYFPLL